MVIALGHENRDNATPSVDDSSPLEHHYVVTLHSASDILF